MFNWLYKLFTGKQRLGPNQRRWIEALRSGEYAQHNYIAALHFIDHEEKHTYCCLGVACVVSDADVEMWPGDPERIRGGGLFEQIGVVKEIALHSDGHKKCVSMNDDLQATFREIADTIENKPQDFFSEPK